MYHKNIMRLFVSILFFGLFLISSSNANALTYLHQNHQGSVVAISDEDGTVVEELEYEPFGESIGETDASYTYTDQELDATDLLYYGARYQGSSI
jgi:hypothetical protein